MLQPYIGSATALSDYYYYVEEFAVFVGCKKWTSST